MNVQWRDGDDFARIDLGLFEIGVFKAEHRRGKTAPDTYRCKLFFHDEIAPPFRRAELSAAKAAAEKYARKILKEALAQLGEDE